MSVGFQIVEARLITSFLNSGRLELNAYCMKNVPCASERKPFWKVAEMDGFFSHYEQSTTRGAKFFF